SMGDVLVAGSILWSRPVPPTTDSIDSVDGSDTYRRHVVEHNRHVSWLEDVIRNNQDKRLLVMTHFVPSFQLIEPKYRDLGLAKTSHFATNLEHLIRHPVRAWVCGHSHSALERDIN